MPRAGWVPDTAGRLRFHRLRNNLFFPQNFLLWRIWEFGGGKAQNFKISETATKGAEGFGLGEGLAGGMFSGLYLHELCWERSREPHLRSCPLMQNVLVSQLRTSPPTWQLLGSRLCSPTWRHLSLESLHLRIQKRSLLRGPRPVFLNFCRLLDRFQESDLSYIPQVSPHLKIQRNVTAHLQAAELKHVTSLCGAPIAWVPRQLPCLTPPNVGPALVISLNPSQDPPGGCNVQVEKH